MTGSNRVTFSIVRIARSTTQETIRLMRSINPSVAGSTSSAVYRALCRDGAHNDRVTFIVALQDHRTIGFSIAVSDWRRYWRLFPFRHPIATISILGARLIRILSRGRQVSTPRSADSVDGSSRAKQVDRQVTWADSSPRIAKMLYLAVDQSTRTQGVGRALYDHTLEQLVSVGVQRVDGRILTGNLASVRFHVAMGGWTMREDGSSILITRVIGTGRRNS